MPKIKVNDINLYYESYGQGEPIIFISGFSADHFAWQNLIDSYSSEYQMIIIDNRGSGQSDIPDMPYTVDMMADDVVALANKLDFDSYHIVGSSMGGAIVQTLAYKYPEKIRTAIISNSFIEIDTKFAITAKTWCQMLKGKVTPKIQIEQSFAWVFSTNFLQQPGNFEMLIELAIANPYPMTEIGLRNQLNALLTFQSINWANKIRVPCLVIGSDEDIIASEKDTRRVASLIPNSQYALIKNAGHLPHIEYPEEFNKIVRDFIKKHA
jgi:pimeloyl-ACP methyl ester carboxylesterase